ncbi:MAG: lytic transglycosylase [Sphingobacteriales bacterium]|nr:lytic transglycosylase [Sphingobacteriales bacterium]
MVKALFFVIGMFLLNISISEASSVHPDSLIVIKSQGISVAFKSKDTLFVPASSENHPSFYENVVYKQRLDSLKTQVPLDYNDIVQRYIDIYLNRKTQISNVLGLSEYYFPIFEKSLQDAGIPEELKYISIIESSLNPHAVSRTGAVGPWQFMYSTAKGYGLQMDNFVDERKDPFLASVAAAAYLKDAYKELGDWLLTIAAYNCGTGSVKRAIIKSGGKRNFWEIRHLLPIETQNYVPAFIATNYVMNYYYMHNISTSQPSFNTFIDVLEVNKVLSLSSIAEAANLDLYELSILNPCYKKKIINGSVKSPKRLIIPAVDKAMFSSLYNVLNGLKPDMENPEIIPLDFRDELLISSKTGYHKVESDESLLLIANRYGVEVQDLKVWNKLPNENIVPGQNLRVSNRKIEPEVIIEKVDKKPEGKYLTYLVQTGDTLDLIANKFAATISSIKITNNLKDAAVTPGMLLRIL